MIDRRSKTSRANLGNHIPEALDPNGTIVVGVRLTHQDLHELDLLTQTRGTNRSETIRWCVKQGLDAAHVAARMSEAMTQANRTRND